MLRDLNKFGTDARFEVDICIVGAGAAGTTLANELVASGRKVLLAESGDFSSKAAVNALNNVEDIAYPSRAFEGRFRQFGGSTSKWTGRCAELDEIDLSNRDWLSGSGWDLDPDQLIKYYRRAERLLGLSDARSLKSKVRKILNFDVFKGSDSIDFFVWRRPSPYPRNSIASLLVPVRRARSIDFKNIFLKKFASVSNITVLTNATLIDFSSDRNGYEVTEAKFQSLEGAAASVAAKNFVICASGVENPRILLSISGPMGERLKKNEALGRFLGQHPRGKIADVVADSTASRYLQETFNVFLRPPRHGEIYETGFALSACAQESYKLLNASGILSYEPKSLDGWMAAKRVAQSVARGNLSAIFLRDVYKMLVDFPALSLFRRFALGREVYFKDPSISVIVDLEQPPLSENFICLSSHCDVSGRPLARISWEISQLERDTARFFAEALREEFSRLKLGNVVPSQWLYSDGPISSVDLVGNYHFIGSTRMSRDSSAGVVDTDLKVHGCQNLFVCGASVFPTGGHANPTLTIVALAIRLGEFLRVSIA